MYTMGYYTSFNHQLLQNAVLYPKNGVRSVNLPIPAKTSKLMSYGSRGVDSIGSDCSMSGITCHLMLCGGSSFLTEFLGVMSVWDLMEWLAAGHQQAG